MSFANKTFLLCWQYSLEILKPQNALKENTSLQDKVKANHSPSGNQPNVCIIFDRSYASIQCCFHWNYWEYKSFSEAPDCLQSKAQWTKSNSIQYLHYLVPSYLSDLPPCERPLFWLCVASVTLLMLSIEYLFSCLSTFRFYLFLSYNAALLQDGGRDALVNDVMFWGLWDGVMTWGPRNTWILS